MESLDTLVERYGKADAQIKELKKGADKDKEEIKTLMENLEENKWTAGGYTVQRIESTYENLNEDKLLATLNNYRKNKDTSGIIVNGIIRTKEYIDLDALEPLVEWINDNNNDYIN